MIIKFSKIINCTSQHPSYPVTNLLEYKSSINSSTWRCAKPGILESEVIFELAEPSPIIGVDIGNLRCCKVRISGATNEEPENWLTIIEHEFMSRNDAEDDRFKDQVQLFTKKEMNQEIIKIVFARVKATCMQPANLKVLFGLSFLILRAEDKTDTGNLDIFGRFKIKENKDDSLDNFKEKYLQQIRSKTSNFKTELVKQIEKKRAAKSDEKSEETPPRKRPSLNVSRSSLEPETSFEKVKQDGIKPETNDSNERKIKKTKLELNSSLQNSLSDPEKAGNSLEKKSSSSKNLGKTEEGILEQKLPKDAKRTSRCSLCLGNEENVLCKICNLLKPEKEVDKPKTRTPKHKKVRSVAKPAKEFTKLFEGVVFSLSGYQNPGRDEIRRKAIAMGAKYVFDISRRNHGCTHLICAFKNTPKYKELKNSAKIVSHLWVEECYDKKTRFPWRRYALDSNDKNAPESEDEVVASEGLTQPSTLYDQDTDSDY